MQNSIKILLVEDDEDDFILTRSLLKDGMGSGYQLDWVKTYQEALDQFAHHQHDVYLVDYRLGERDGLALVGELIEGGCKTPILLLTGQGSYSLDVEAMRVGATDYLVKGEVTPTLLERTIRYAIERKQAEDALRRAHDELELRVQERTQELAQANEVLRAEIVERKRAESALRESESRFRTLAETTSSAIFIVQDTKIRYVNQAVKPITGFEPAELLNLNFWEIAHPTYREILKKNGLTSHWAGEFPSRYELKLLTKSGEIRWVDVTAGAMEYGGQPALVVTAFDITERDLAEQALRKAKGELEERVMERTAELSQANSQLEQANRQLMVELAERERLLAQLEAERAKLSTIIANAPEGIVVADRDGRILLTNPAAERLYARPIPYGQDYSSHAQLYLCYPDGSPCPPRQQPLIRSALDGETHSNLELSILLPDGNYRNLLVNSAPIRDRYEAINGAITIFQDITQRKQDEADRLRDAAHIEVQHHLIQYREMERLHIARDLHDGPLQELIGITFALADTFKMAADSPILPRLHQVQGMLQQQIRELRAFCSELRPPTLVPFGLEKAIRSHVDSFQTRYPQVNVELDLMRDGLSLPEPVRLALFRIFQELLNNVLRHAKATQVLVRLSLDEEQIVLEVHDNGQGFEVPKHWVDLARQGHLGLVGVQERAEAVGGTMEIDSSPGSGAIVQVSIPRSAIATPVNLGEMSE